MRATNRTLRRKCFLFYFIFIFIYFSLFLSGFIWVVFFSYYFPLLCLFYYSRCSIVFCDLAITTIIAIMIIGQPHPVLSTFYLLAFNFFLLFHLLSLFSGPVDR